MAAEYFAYGRLNLTHDSVARANLPGWRLPDDFKTAARAVSGGANGSNPPCLLATEETLKDGFKVNSGSVNTTGCEVQVNSGHNTRALYVNSQGSLEAPARVDPATLLKAKQGRVDRALIQPNQVL